jgi:outer membrane protein assembly factor BamB
MNPKLARFALALPVLATLAAVVALAVWWARGPNVELKVREPFTDLPPGADTAAVLNPLLAGKLLKGDGQPTDLPGAWPQFRGPSRDGVSPERAPLARAWPANGPRELWAIDVGEGYAGAAVLGGRLYVMDYDRDSKQGALRCLSLADGKEIWRYAYPLSVKRNHGMTRTMPAVTAKYVVAMDPKCNVVCVDAASGEFRWGVSLVREYGTIIPPWYTGQCPLIDGHAVILAPAGRDALLAALDLETGKPLWQTPNPRGWKMTHSSVMPMEFAGKRMYLYCGSGGVVAASATDGAILWDTTEWKISLATVPSPLVLDGGKVFFSGGYNAGSLMLQLKDENGKLVPRTVFKLAPEVFGATQHTPVFRDGYIYGVRPDGQFVCLDLSGKVVWASGPGTQFGLGSFLLAEGLIFALNDSGKLSLLEASTAKFTPLAQAQVLKGRESWGPMSLVGNRLLLRDLTRMACLEVGPPVHKPVD